MECYDLQEKLLKLTFACKTVKLFRVNYFVLNKLIYPQFKEINL